MSRTWWAIGLAAALLAAGLSASVAGCAGTYTTISPDEVQQRLASADPVFLLDVRTPGEYDSGHLPGATLIPVQELGSRLSEVPADTTVIVYCATASRSAEAAGILAGAGYGDVFNMAQGIQAWRGPIER
ncbi:MAG: rhodanese-like domain-containing protein [Thermoleophilia bacterium]